MPVFCGMKVKELLKFIPDEEISFLAATSKVDHQIKKLDGLVMFKLILFSLLHNQSSSLRIMEHLYSSMRFRMIAGLENETTRFNSIRDRIATIKYTFFEKIFLLLFDRFNKYFHEEDALLRYDSTMIAISSSLVKWGMMKVGSKNTNIAQLKYTVATKGSFPCHVKIFNKPEALNEDKTIPAAILENDISKSGIVVFDRGVQARKTFEELTESQRLFVTRMKTDVRYRTLENIKGKNKKGDSSSSVKVHEDLKVLLKNQVGKWTTLPFRLIKTENRETGEPICFLTNIWDLSAQEIAFVYKQRWEIEVFFKYLKQHLNLKHLVARSENGIRVMLYMTLILSILIIAYKKLNKIETFKIAKLKFALDLESAIVKEIVILSGGDPLRMPHLFSDA